MNKLYEETAVSNIADAIRETTTGVNDKYTVSQMADAIRSGKRRVYKGTVTSAIVGSGKYLTIAKEDILAQHRGDATLFVRVEFDVAQQPYTIVKSWGSNTPGVTLPENTTGICQKMIRWGSNGNRDYNATTSSVNTTSPSGVGCLQITADGELRIYSNSASNYAIRPSNYIAIVEW